MSRINYVLSNHRMGGFAFVTKEQFLAWKANPATACQQDKSLLTSLNGQNLNRGFNYDYYTPQVIIN